MHEALLALSLGVACAATGCRPLPYDFSHAHRPRMAVLHRPLHPAPGDTITISAVAEGTSSAPVTQIHLTFLRAGQPAVDHDCTGQSTCDLTVAAPSGAGPAYATYGGWVEDPPGHRWGVGSYGFDIGQPPGQLVLDLRVPVTDKTVLRTLFVRDAATYSTDAALWADAETFLEQQILVDPAWRWRDYQLGFYYDVRPGQTSDYYSGLSTRCGQDPWPGIPTPPEALFADAIGVIHRDSTFRDCGGLGVVTMGASPRRNFSAYGPNPRVVQHEMGHALFGLGDEYWESEATRRIPGVPFNPQHPCQCCDPGGHLCSVDSNGDIVCSGNSGAGGGSGAGGSGAGGCPDGAVVEPPPDGAVVEPPPDGAVVPPPPPPIGAVGSGHGTATGGALTGTTLGAGGRGAGGIGGLGGTLGAGGAGGITVTCMPGMPSCAGWMPPSDCAARAPQCPPLPGRCWRQNDFPTQAACQTEAARIALNPGVETSVAPAECRQLCGPGPQPCPCAPPCTEVWIVDRQHPPLVSTTGDDIMATKPMSLIYNGAACDNCLEATFCMMWETGPGRNRTLADAEAWCLRY